MRGGVPVVPQRTCKDYQEYQDDVKSLKEQGFQWIGSKGPAAAHYEPNTHHREGFTISSHDGSQRWTIKVGDCCAMAVQSRDNDSDGVDNSGEISTWSMARVLAILEDRNGHCWVALHYFWRWGQIHALADVAGREHGLPRLLAPRWSAELFLQQEELLDSDSHGCNALYAPNGTYRELLSAALVVRPVTVLTYQQVLQRYPGLSETEALDQYEADFHDDTADARTNGFWWRFRLDHTSYSFVTDPAAVDVQLQRLDPAGRTMADIFCGPGHCAVAARSAGWSVSFGVDADHDAISSFAANTMDFPHEPFNPPGSAPAEAFHCTVEEFEAAVQAGRLDPGSVGYMHFSPPCQELSQYKLKRLRRFTGATISAIPRIVELVQPAFISLEEVHGFILHHFTEEGMLVWEEAAKQQQQQQQRQQQSSQAPAASSGPDTTEAAAAESPPPDDDGSGEEEADPSFIPLMNHPGQQQTNEGGVTFQPFLLVVPQLLSMGYQVRMCLLQSAHYGVPQRRWRVILFAAKIGYELPMPPAPRYETPPSIKAVLADSSKQLDPNLMPKGSQSATWFDILTAAVNAQLPADGQLLPTVTIADAIGDLPPIICSRDSYLVQHSRPRTTGASARNPQGNSEQGPPAADGGGGGGGGSCSSSTTHLQQQQQAASSAHQPARGGLKQRLANIRRQALVVAQRQADSHTYGRDFLPYEPQQGVLLCQLPPPVADLHPVSAFAQLCRTRHWQGQQHRDYNFLALRHHTYCGTAPTKLPTDKDIMDCCGVVGTIVCKDNSKCSTVHFAEPRQATLAERRRFQGVPDWLQYSGTLSSQHRQAGNAVPYLMAAEISASVLRAATGVDGSRPPALAGPSPAGVGISEADMPRYRSWFNTRPWAEVVLSSRAALQKQLTPAGEEGGAAVSGGTLQQRSTTRAASPGPSAGAAARGATSGGPSAAAAGAGADAADGVDPGGPAAATGAGAVPTQSGPSARPDATAAQDARAAATLAGKGAAASQRQHGTPGARVGGKQAPSSSQGLSVGAVRGSGGRGSVGRGRAASGGSPLAPGAQQPQGSQQRGSLTPQKRPTSGA